MLAVMNAPGGSGAFFGRRVHPLAHSRAAQQVHHVPDAVVADDAVDLRRDHHGDAAGDAALDGAAVRKRVQRQLRAMGLVHLDARHLFRRRQKGDELLFHRHVLVRLVRKHVAKPPHHRDDEQKEPKHSESDVGHQRRGNKYHSQGQQEWPRGGRRQMHGPQPGFPRSAFGKHWIPRFHHRPMTYTTVKTTTHTASTKCQYMASTLTRSACWG